MNKKQSTSLSLVIDGENFKLNTEKLLIGSGENCDIKIDHNSISNYQAMIFTDHSGVTTVVDLEAQNGTFINGVRVNGKSAFFDGDTLTFGKVHCEIVESTEETIFESREEHVQIYSELNTAKVHVPEQTNENQILIDDEYCDIVFSDNEFTPLLHNPVHDLKVDENEFVPTDELDEAFDIAQKSDGRCIQVTTTVNGSLQDQFYFPMQDGTVKAFSSAKKNSVLVDIGIFDAPETLFRVNQGVLEVSDIEGFVSSKKEMSLTPDQIIVMTCGTFQIFIEVAPVPAKLAHISSLRRDRAFYFDTAKKFAAVILPMLLLLLVDFTIEKKTPLKKLSIIYKKPTKTVINDSKSLASKNPNNTKKDTGHKSTKQPDKKISHSKSGAKKQPKKSPKKAVAKSAAPASKKAKAKTKAYDFKVATNVDSLFSNSSSVSVSNSKSVSNVSTTSSVTGSLDTKVNGTSSAEVGQLGKDSAGRGPASFGSKGLSSKSGRDTAYIQTETVVLGSMDPELLRKILQQYLPQFRHCYQQELAYNSEDIKGIVDLNFEISGSGKVGKINIRAKDSRFSKRGINCMGKVLGIIDFPKPKGGGRVAVRQPLSFFSEKE